MLVNTFITVWFLITGPESYRPPVQMGPYYDQSSCVRVQNSTPLNGYATSQCVQVDIPATGYDCSRHNNSDAVIESTSFPTPKRDK